MNPVSWWKTPALSPAAVLGQITVLLLIYGALALFVNAIRPGGLAWRDPLIRAMPWSELAYLAKNHRVQWVDARPEAEYAQGHISGALNIPADEKARYLSRIFQELPADRDLVLYCRGYQCPAGRELALFLVRNGVAAQRISLFSPGWEFLRAQDQVPLQTGAKP